jgi:hypothetical protein
MPYDGDYKNLPQSEIVTVEEVPEEVDSDSDIETSYEEGSNRKSLLSGTSNLEGQSEDNVNDDEESIQIKDEMSERLEDSKKSDSEVEKPIHPKVACEMSKLTTYYNSGKALSKMRSGRRYNEDEDLDGSNDNNDGNDGIYYVAAMVVECFENWNDPFGFIDHKEVVMMTIDLKKYERMDPNKVPLSIYRDIFTSLMRFDEA